MRTIFIALLVVAAVLAPSTNAAAQQDEDGIILPDDLQAPRTIDPDVLATYIVPLDPDIRPLVSTIEDLDGGLSERTGGEETVISLNADVFFDFDSDEVKPEGRTTLQELAQQLENIGELRITGHTDSMGNDAYNLDLSRRRAESVAEILSQLDPALSISTDGKGETEPVAPNKTADGGDYPEGRALNRRVEIRYTP